jgi:hypothetical protein
MWADDASKIDMLAYRPYADLITEILLIYQFNKFLLIGSRKVFDFIENLLYVCHTKKPPSISFLIV